MPDAIQLQTLDTFLMVLSFVLGALVGSFCNVCVSRWPSGESVVSPRSRCPKCMNSIAWYDNIPVVSWLVLGAKCRNCGLPISWQYPLVEALTGVLFLLVYLNFGLVVATPVYMLLAAAMVVVTFQDLADWTIPNEITFPGIPLGLVLSLLGMYLGEASGLRVTDVFDSLLGIVLGGGILYLLDRITVLVLKKPGMGFGDVKLLAMLGAFIGWQGVLGTLVIASFVGSFVGLTVLLVVRLREAAGTPSAEGADAETPAAPAKAKDEAPLDSEDEEITLSGHYLPFGPYLAFGGLVWLFFGPELLEWYLEFLRFDPMLTAVLLP